MNRKFSIALAVVGVLVLGVAATDANAQCNPAKVFNSAFGAGGDSFLVFPADADTTVGGPNLKGRFWQPGARTLHNEGSGCPEATYLLETAPGQIAVFGQMGGDILGTGPCLNTGCPAGNMIILVQTKNTSGSKSYFAVGRTVEVEGTFDFGSGANWQVVGAPRPRVTTSGRAGANVNVNVAFDAPSNYTHSATPAEAILTGYQILRVNSNTDPGRNPAAWGAPVQTVASTASGATAGLVVDCSAVTTDVFISTRAVFDGGQFLSDDVSEATRVECDPTLADPRFNQIQKKNPRSNQKPVNPR